MLVISYAKLFQIKIKSRISKHLNWFLLFPIDGLTNLRATQIHTTNGEFLIFRLILLFILFFAVAISFGKKQ